MVTNRKIYIFGHLALWPVFRQIPQWLFAWGLAVKDGDSGIPFSDSALSNLGYGVKEQETSVKAVKELASTSLQDHQFHALIPFHHYHFSH